MIELEKRGRKVQQERHEEKVVWYPSPTFWAAAAFGVALLIAVFHHGLTDMVVRWNNNEAYGYAYLIPFISAFLIWQRKSMLQVGPLDGSWAALLVVLAGMVLYFAGHFSTITTLIQYAFLVTLIGTAAALLGWRAVRPILVPLLFLMFMIPLPGFFYNNLSSKLQLLSSQLGVDFMRLFNVSVYLEGNVIDLGVFKLQVVDACSGLRYLFPLMTLAFIAAYMFKGRFWKKFIIFLSSIPITVLMNSFRVGMIGILVNYWGIGQAEGFRHYFEGWVIFMVCIGILVGEMWVLSKFGADRQRSLSDAFGIDMPEPMTAAHRKSWRVTRPFWGALGLVVVSSVLVAALGVREQRVPARQNFTDFPVTIGQWRGIPDQLQQIYLNQLKLTDYILADYSNPKGDAVNFYVAYYASQTAGDSAHSPRSCIPGGGWVVNSLTQRTIPVGGGRPPVRVNRTLITKGNVKEVVYYWFQEQGRNVTNEYMVKWWIFWDALTRHRTDGALVRLVTTVRPGEDDAQADARLTAFLREVYGYLPAYVPN
ncbi:MAG: VPLPA-CTERM-specific exosortase XrtD [Gammaproteobacteria bacterium]